MPFAEALAHLLAKRAMPTGLDSAGLRALDAGIRRQSLFSAKTMLEGYLEDLQATIASLINPRVEQRADRITPENPTGQVNTGFNPATARAALREKLLNDYGYGPGEGERGTLQDLSSDARLNLVLKTNTELAQGAGHFVQANADPDVVDLWPAAELYRLEARDEPRNWSGSRWMLAAQTAGDVDAARVLEATGRMVALKSSGIWQALGDGAGGFTDTLGNPYPPFAFNSGMWVEDVSRREAEDLGLLDPGEPAEPAAFDFGSLFNPPTS
jgi:hypothetical protein